MQLPKLVLFFSLGTHCAALILNSLVSPQLLEKKQSTYTRWQSPLIAAALLDYDNTSRLPGHSHIRSPAKAFYRTMGGSSQQADQSSLVYCNMVLECKSIEGQEPSADIKMCGECVPKLVKLRMPCYLSCAKWVGKRGRDDGAGANQGVLLEKSSSLLQKENTRESTASGRHALMHKAQSTPGQIGCNQVFGVFQDSVYGRFEMEMAMMTFIEGEDLKLALYQLSCRSFGSLAHFQELAVWGQMKSAIVLMPPQTALKYPNQCQEMSTFVYSARVASSFIVNDQIRCGAEYRLSEEEPEFETMTAPVPALVCNFCNKPFVEIDKKAAETERVVDEDKDYRSDATSGECVGRSCTCSDECETFFGRCFEYRRSMLYSCDAFEECREEFDNTGGNDVYDAGDADAANPPYNRRRTVWASAKEDSYCEPLCAMQEGKLMTFMEAMLDYNSTEKLDSTCVAAEYSRRRRVRRRMRRREAVAYQDRRRARRRRADAAMGDMSNARSDLPTSSCDECCSEKNAEITLSIASSSGAPQKMTFAKAGNCAFFVNLCIKIKRTSAQETRGEPANWEHLLPFFWDECRAPIDNPCTTSEIQGGGCKFFNEATQANGLGQFTKELCEKYTSSLYRNNAEEQSRWTSSNDFNFCKKMFKPNGDPKSHGYRWIGEAIQGTCEQGCVDGDSMTFAKEQQQQLVNFCQRTGGCSNSTTVEDAYSRMRANGQSSFAEMKNEDYYYY